MQHVHGCMACEKAEHGKRYQDPAQRIVDVLKLGEPSQYRDHTYINGESMYFPTGRVYGGQVISQSLIAASKTVPEDRLPIRSTGISSPRATFTRICCSMWRICATGTPSPRAV